MFLKVQECLILCGMLNKMMKINKRKEQSIYLKNEI